MQGFEAGFKFADDLQKMGLNKRRVYLEKDNLSRVLYDMLPIYNILGTRYCWYTRYICWGNTRCGRYTRYTRCGRYTRYTRYAILLVHSVHSLGEHSLRSIHSVHSVRDTAGTLGTFAGGTLPAVDTLGTLGTLRALASCDPSSRAMQPAMRVCEVYKLRQRKLVTRKQTQQRNE